MFLHLDDWLWRRFRRQILLRRYMIHFWWWRWRGWSWSFRFLIQYLWMVDKILENKHFWFPTSTILGHKESNLSLRGKNFIYTFIWCCILCLFCVNHRWSCVVHRRWKILQIYPLPSSSGLYLSNSYRMCFEVVFASSIFVSDSSVMFWSSPLSPHSYLLLQLHSPSVYWPCYHQIMTLLLLDQDRCRCDAYQVIVSAIIVRKLLHISLQFT